MFSNKLIGVPAVAHVQTYYSETSGFDTSMEEQITYNSWFAKLVSYCSCLMCTYAHVWFAELVSPLVRTYVRLCVYFGECSADNGPHFFNPPPPAPACTPRNALLSCSQGRVLNSLYR